MEFPKFRHNACRKPLLGSAASQKFVSLVHLAQWGDSGVGSRERREQGVKDKLSRIIAHL